MKFPIGVQDFRTMREDGYVYVDKTAYVHSLASMGKAYFLSRPRRFGKSLLVSTMECYFRGERELFRGLDLERLETEWKKHPVFHVDFSEGNYSNPRELDLKISKMLRTWETSLGIEDDGNTTVADRFSSVISKARERAGSKVVVLIDEYDKPLLDVMDGRVFVEDGGVRVTVEEHNRNLLRGFLSPLKGADADLRFVFLTGVTKFSKISIFSDLNHLDDISMTAQYDCICGITQEELDSVFPTAVESLAVEYGMTVSEMCAALRKNYDGYNFSRRMKGVYNPYSLIKAFKDRDMGDYWFKSGTPTMLIRLLAKASGNLGEMAGQFYAASQLEEYRATGNFPLPIIYQSGYLTLKEYDRSTESYKVDFPNDEVTRGFVTLVADDYLKPQDTMSINWAQRAVKALNLGQLEVFRQELTAFLASVPYSVRRHDNERERERYFQFAFYLLLRIAGTYTTLIEQESSCGRADCIVETPRFVYIFEFKLDRPAKEALAQIDSRGYAAPYATDRRELIKVGASFSSETGTICEWEVG